MDTSSSNRTLIEHHDRALEELELASGLLIHDDEKDPDRSLELSLTEAGYGAACFSRALRCAGAGMEAKGMRQDLFNSIADSISLMSGSGRERLYSFLTVFFDPKRLVSGAEGFVRMIRDSISRGTFDELRRQESFQDRTLDYFLFFDRFHALKNPDDSPFDPECWCSKGLEQQVAAFFSKLQPVFDTRSAQLEHYRQEMLIPKEPAYALWFYRKPLSAKAFITFLQEEFSPARQKRTGAVRAAVSLLPSALSKKIEGLGLEQQLAGVSFRMEKRFQSAIDDIADALWASPGAEVPVWSEKKDDVSYILSRHRQEIDRCVYRLKQDPDMPPGQRRQALILACVLTGDEHMLQSLLSEIDEHDQ